MVSQRGGLAFMVFPKFNFIDGKKSHFTSFDFPRIIELFNY